MVPAQQNFKPEHLTSFNLRLWLVHQAQFVVIDCDVEALASDGNAAESADSDADGA